jgi:GTP-binding protein HflX
VTLIERTFREKIVLVGVVTPPSTEDDVEAHLDELELLVDTAGADVVDRVVQRRERPDPATYIGKGKADELRVVSETVDADTVVFDDELTPAQSRNHENILGRTAIDRTAVILDNFAQNARTQEGRAQVELAFLRYRLPRLRGRGTQLSRQGGGLGTRFGAGETKLEVDRRRILQRIAQLERELTTLTKTRREQRKQRSRTRLRSASLVGYTNAGKSTLLNRLTDADVLVEDRLFATLDPRTRRLDLPGGEQVLLTDTVGFIRKLPHGLVESFKSTLEIVSESDLLVHVVDASAPDPEGQIESVQLVLEEIEADRVPQLLVFNKADVTPDAKRLVDRHAGSVAISAVTGDGIDRFLNVLSDRLRALDVVVELVVPYARGDVLAAVHREGEVIVEAPEDDSVRLRARLDEAGASRFREFVV